MKSPKNPIPLLLSFFLAFLPGFAHAENPRPSAPLEIFVYINGDNDLLSQDSEGHIVHQGEVTFHHWVKIAETSPPHVHVHIFFDPNQECALQGPTETTHLRYEGGILLEHSLLGETNSGDPKHLRRLMEGRFSESNADATSILVLWGHGNGWRDIEDYDYSSSDNSFSYSRFADILAAKPVDLLIFDACSMGYLEVMRTFRHSARSVLATQFELPVDGIPWRLFNPGIHAATRRDIAEHLMQLTHEFQNKQAVRAPFTWFDLSHLETVERELDTAKSRIGERAIPWTTLQPLARARLRGALQPDAMAMDLRRLALALQNQFQIDTSSFQESLELLMPLGGSIQFTSTPDQGESHVFTPVARIYPDPSDHCRSSHSRGSTAPSEAQRGAGEHPQHPD